MSKLAQRTRNLFLVLVAALGIGGFAFLLPNALRAAYAVEGGVPALQAESTDKAGDDSLTVLAFTSDVHNKYNGNVAATRNGTWLKKMKALYGDIDAMAFGGDMGDASDGTNFWTNSQKVMDAVSSEGVEGVYTTGNHEYNPGSYSASSTNTTQQAYKINTVGKVGENYIIYCLGSVSSSQSYASQINSLRTYLDSVGTDKPIFIITHFPLHYTNGNWGGRTTASAIDIIHVLNDATDDGKKIVYLWGHNHTEAPTETHYDEVFAPGDSLQYASSANSTEEIKFYYAAAGCMSDSEYSNSSSTGSGAVKGKGLIVTVDSKDKLSFAYYDENGNNVTEGGTFTEQDPVPITGVSITKNGTVTTVEKGRSITLETSVTPDNATVKSKTWTSDNTAVATVDSNGKVKGMSEGTAAITVTVSDGINRTVVTDSIEVTVIPRTSSGRTFEYAETFSPDKNYIIANKQDGTAYALTNSNGSIGTTQVTVDDGVITLDDENEDIVFTTSGNGSSVTDFENNERYLKISGSSYNNVTFSLSTTAHNLDWTYTGNRLSSHRAANTSTVYYLYYNASGSTYSCSNTESSSSSPRDIYLFEEIEEQVPVASVTIDRETAEVEARKTIQLTATVLPTNATNRSVTWSSSDTSIATVDENGKVKGVSEGTAIITVASAVDPTKTATCTVTVTPNDSPLQAYVITIDGYALSTTKSQNSAQGGSAGYDYRGLTGVAFESGAAADDGIRWIFEPTDGGYYIKSLDGRYLNATYQSGTNSGHGDLELNDTPDVWVPEDGFSLEDGTIDGTLLKSTNASKTATSDKYLAYEESPANLFTVRSHDYADTITVEEAVDPILVTNVTVTPAEATIEVGKTTPLAATVEPTDASNKDVTWSSSNTSIATVDENGKVKGIAEGTATITATAKDSSGKSGSSTVTVVPRTSEDYFVIMIDNYALSSNVSSEMMSNSQGYEYHGLDAVPYSTSDPAPYDILWTIEEVDGVENGYYIKSYNGAYLSATYVRGSGNGYTGTLTVGDTQDVWVAEDGMNGWTGNGTYLRSTNASNNPRPADIYLTTRASNNSVDFFTVGSSNNYKTSKLVVPESIQQPVAVTDITLDPTSLEVQIGKSAQITANVLPENADDKTVSWTSDDESIATVDNNGRVRGIAQGTTTITATTNDGAKTATCEVTVTPSSAPGIGYVITIGDYAMSCEPSSDKLVNAGSGTQQYTYTGLTGVPYDGTDEASEEILWLIEPTDGGYYIKSQDGRYLNATYTTNSTGGSDGVLKVDDTPDVWTFEGSLEDWMLNGSTLKSTNSGKSITHEEGTTSAPINLFTVRSTGESSHIIDPDNNDAEQRFVEVNSLSTGKDYIIAVTASGNSVYAVENVTGTSSGNTGSATLSVNPAAGDEPAYIVTDNTGVVWNYTSNKYLSNNSRYLSRPSSGTAVPYASQTGRAVTYSSTNKRLSVSYNGTYYLTNSNGTFGYTQTSGSAAQVRLFEKQTVFNFKYVVQFVSNGVNYQSSKYAAGEVPVYTGTTPTRAENAQFTYTFSGWSSDGGTTTYGPDEALPAVTGPVTYTAQFTATPKPQGHTVTFNTDGGTEINAQTVADGEKATKPETDPTKDGCFAFGGWYSDEELTAEYDFDTPVSEDITLYAKWNDAHNLTKVDAAPATCTEAGHEAYWTCSVCGKLFSDEAGTTGIEAPVTIPATNHSWEFSGWTWAEDNSSATANYTCKNDASHTQEVTATVTTTTVDATCTVAGTVTYTASVTGEASLDGTEHTDTKTVTGQPLGHNYVLTAWTWTGNDTDGYTAATVTFTCANDETHVGTINATVTTNTDAATCEADGKTTYRATATFANEEYSDLKEVTIPATGHNWGEATYEWAADNKSVTATRACANDPEHVETETAAATSEVTKAATCEEAGETTYTATFRNGAFSVQTKIVAIPATGHDWGEATYEWADDNSSVIATRTCKNDATHAETETVTTTSEVTKAATCEAKGETTYTADFKNEAFSAQTKTLEDVPALGHAWGEWSVTKPATCTEAGVETRICAHDASHTETRAVDATGHAWGEVAYTWSEDNTKVTATRTCANDEAHVETETVAATSEVTKQPTCEGAGETTWTSAAFENEAFEAQTKVEAITATGHAWEFKGFTWTGSDADGYTAATTNYTCKNDETHTKSIDAAIEQSSSDATCTDAGTVTYSASVSAEASLDGKAHTDSKTVTGQPLGHAWGNPIYTWSEDNSSVTAMRTCANDASHVETETVAATSEVTKAATCEAKGKTTWTSAAFENEAFSVQTKTIDNIPALGHDWRFSGWTWTGNDADGYTAATATFTCSNDDTHVESINATVTTTTVDATCTEAGKVTYTAVVTFANEEYSDTKDATIPALGHDWGEWETTKPATCTEKGVETRTCKNDETHVETRDIEATGHTPVTDPAVDPTCTETGLTEGSHCSVCGEVLVAQQEIPATGHTPVTDPAVAPTCTMDGLTEGSHCSVCGEELMAQETVSALGHDWSETTYEWSDDNSSVTATRTCANDETHVETETVAATSEVTRPATCEAKGETTWTSAAFKNAAFSVQTKTLEDIPATGHAWGEATYAWDEDNSAVTATRTCANDEAHVETETVAATSEVTRPATCEAKGETTYTSAAFENAAFETQIKTIEDIPATGHTPGEAQHENEVHATCSTEGSYNEVVRCIVCNKVLESTPKTIEKLSHTPADAVIENEIAATCEGDGSYDSVVYCSVCGDEISRNTETVPALGHDWGEWETTTPATCTEAGVETRACKRNESHTETRTVEPTGHNYGDPKFTWVKAEDSDDYVKVIAVMICSNDNDHIVYEEVEITDDMVKIDPEPTATEKGKKTYTVPFTNSAFGTQEKEVVLPPEGYIYDDPTYEWKNEDGNWICTATAECLNAEDADIVEKGTVTSTITKVATCTEEGETTYTATFKSEKFDEQTKTEPIGMIDHTPAGAIVDNVVEATCETDGSYDNVVKCSVCGIELNRETVTVPALGHTWANQTYVWADDNTTATATAVCSRDGSHILEETVSTTSETVHATCVADGTITYTAAFTKDAFSTQSKMVKGDPATGHVWGEVTYEWADDNSTVTATRTCANDATHVETETVETTYEVTKAATCEEAGTGTWTSAAFANEAFEVQTKTADIQALGHAWGDWSVTTPATCTEAGVETRVCTLDESHTETRAVKAAGHKLTKVDAVPATCTEAGTKAYWTCSVCDKLFSDKDGATEIDAPVAAPALGHSYKLAGWTWKEDDKGYMKATAKFTCTRDSSHVTKKAATVTYKVTAATGAKSGTIVYTATIKAENSPTGKAVTAKKTVVVAPTLLTVKVSGSTMKLSWAKNAAASNYKVYYSKCSESSKLYKTVDSSITTLDIPKLANGNHKAIIVTYKRINNKLVKVSSSAAVHVKVGTSGTLRNATTLTLQSKSSVTLAKGKTSQIKATISTTSGYKLFYENHTPMLRYATSNTAVATVSASGKITAKAAGTCKIYVIGPNGIRKVVTVTVK